MEKVFSISVAVFLFVGYKQMHNELCLPLILAENVKKITVWHIDNSVYGKWLITHI